MKESLDDYLILHLQQHRFPKSEKQYKEEQLSPLQYAQKRPLGNSLVDGNCATLVKNCEDYPVIMDEEITKEAMT